jgi:putative Mn2+ efflux pump MntP
MDFSFFFNSVLFGVGLAMDAFSVSLANGLNDPKMKIRRTMLIASVFTFFQFVMPLIGWACVSTMANRFKAFEKYIPYIALVLLVFIGGKMLYEGIRGGEEESGSVCITALLVQGVATSIDALSVGFTISDYDFFKALMSCLIIGVVTFIICFAGVEIGKKAGTKLAGKASVFGGVILIFIGLEIFISSFF